MKKIIKISLIVIIALFLLIQLYRPERFTTAEVTPDHITKKLNVPANVESILRRSCFDCHSNHTNWPWYSNVAPASWLLADDVETGRKEMNFSEWGKMPESKREIKLESICEEIEEGEMPLPKYLILHPDAKLSDADKKILCDWAESQLEGAGSEDESEHKGKDDKK
ncbi:MAG: cytochrome C [Ignavibacteriae bacterium]|nr:MAG: cytochrome C [Ignavibacteriota bacterium]